MFKTIRDSRGNNERYKARLVAKGFTQGEGIDHNENYSPISTKDAFRIIMAFVAHFDFFYIEWMQKRLFLNGKLSEEIVMKKPKKFLEGGDDQLL